MAYTVLFSFILLAWTLSLGIGQRTYPEKCIISVSSRYSSVSQYCFSNPTQKVKPAVCVEIQKLFDEICSFNISSTAFPLPEPHTVSKDNCVLLCADIDMTYVSVMIDGSIHKCTTLCTMDSEAVAVFLTLFQLKDFIAALVNASVPKLPNEESTTAEFKPKEEHSAAAKNSTEQLQQSSSASKAVVNASAPIEPNEKSTNAAAGENDSTPIEANITLKPVTTVATEKKPVPDVTPTTTVATEKKSTPDVKPTTTAAIRPSPAKSTKKTTTTTVATEEKTTPDVKPASTDATEKKTTPNVKPASTAAGENDSTPKEADTSLKPTITDVTEKKPAPDVKPTITDATEEKRPDLKPASTAVERKPAPAETDGKQITTEQEDPALDKINDIEESDNNDEMSSLPKSTHSKTDEKDETSRLDDTPSSYHFLIYFLAFIVLCVAAYIAFHNKHKIIAFVIEGKQGRRGGRPSTKQYTPLKSKVEDVMPFIEKSTTQSNYIY